MGHGYLNGGQEWASKISTTGTKVNISFSTTAAFEFHNRIGYLRSAVQRPINRSPFQESKVDL
jgi:hypothetical protein